MDVVGLILSNKGCRTSLEKSLEVVAHYDGRCIDQYSLALHVLRRHDLLDLFRIFAELVKALQKGEVKESSLGISIRILSKALISGFEYQGLDAIIKKPK